jgi:hypothetical protein
MKKSKLIKLMASMTALSGIGAGTVVSVTSCDALVDETKAITPSLLTDELVAGDVNSQAECQIITKGGIGINDIEVD